MATRFLLDSHVAFWWDQDRVRISRSVLRAVSDPDNEIFVSAVTLWELAIKKSTGKLFFGGSFTQLVSGHDFLELPVLGIHTDFIARLPLHHRDPFDRMLVAQAQAERLTLITADQRLAAYDVSILRA